MTPLRRLGISLIVWFMVWLFWLAMTHQFHPMLILAVIVTTCLVLAYAVESYLNQLLLIPKYWRAGRRWEYALWLSLSMTLLTAGALAAIRISYLKLWGADADPYGVYKHFAIDLFGMIVHVSVSNLAVQAFNGWFSPNRPHHPEPSSRDDH